MTPGGRRAAFTRVELAVVVAAIVLLLALFIPATLRARDKSQRIQCVRNLMEIGVAYRVWSNDRGEIFPAAVAQTNGGWRELLNLPNASTYAWTNFAVMSGALGNSPSVLVCPTDERKPAASFAKLANTNISYFIAPGADDTFPQGILGGDRNLGPGTTPDPEYGYSPSNGQGNDVTIKGPVCWSLKMHSKGNSGGAGNIMLSDGSSQMVTSWNFYENWVKPNFVLLSRRQWPSGNFHANSGKPNLLSANAPGGTNVAGIRLIFP